jgi:urease alpha subunit
MLKIFVSKLSIENGAVQNYGLHKTIYPVRKCRGLKKTDMKLNCALPVINVDPETYQVTADGELLTCEPLAKLPVTNTFCFKSQSCVLHKIKEQNIIEYCLERIT